MKKDSCKTEKISKKVYKIGETCALSDLKVKQTGKVISFSCDSKVIRRRLLDMGVTKNCVIKIKQISPLGDPVTISLRGYDLCLRKKDMNNVLVEVVE